jgi:serine/threonine protein phosphatase PrpC
VLSDQQAVDLIAKETNAQAMSDKLVKAALEGGTKDNVSVIVLQL